MNRLKQDDFLLTQTATTECVNRTDACLRSVIDNVQREYRRQTGCDCDFVIVGVPVGKMEGARQQIIEFFNITPTVQR